MDTTLPALSPHPEGEQPPVEEFSATAGTFAGRVHLEWDSGELVTPLGQLPFFIDYLKQARLFAGWVADCPLAFSSPNAPSKRDLLGTVLLSVLSGHYHYAHITALRCDAVNPRLLGMKKVVSEDAVRRGLAKLAPGLDPAGIDEASGLAWLQTHLDYCASPLLSEPWVLDIDSVALIFNWRSLFVRLADSDHRPEAITSRPLLMQAIARQTQHAGQVTLTISSTHGEQHKARRAYIRIAGFLAQLRQTAEQLNPVQRWYRILSEALKRYLKGRQLDPPLRLAPA